MPQVGFNRLSQPRNRLREIAGQTRVPLTGGTPQPPPQPQPSGLEAMLMELLSQPESELKPPSPIPLPAQRKQPQGFWETMAQEFLPRVAESTLNMEGSIDKRRATEDADAMARYEAEQKAQQQEFDNTLGVATYKRLGQANKISAAAPVVSAELARRDRPDINVAPGNVVLDPNTRQPVFTNPARPDQTTSDLEHYMTADEPTRQIIDRYRKSGATQGGTRMVQTKDASGNPVWRIVPNTPGSEFPSAPTAQMRNTGFEREMLRPGVQSLNELSQKIITKATVLSQRTNNTLRAVESQFGNDPDYLTYKAARHAMSLAIAAIVNQGRPTEPDREAVEGLLPNPFSDTKDSTAQKWEYVYMLLRMSTPGSQAPSDTSPPTVPNAGLPTGIVPIPQGAVIGQ